MSWLQMELGLPGSEIGGLFRIGGHHGGIKELVPDQLTQPGGVDVSRGDIYLTGPVFGPGSLMKVGSHHHH